jgi:putative flippase GtrA
MSDAEALGRPSLSRGAILARYVLFAVAAGVANIATQAIVVRVLPGVTLMVSILSGTAVGFLVKYLLDKHWVFFDPYQDAVGEARKIAAYGAFGVATTLLFWAVELGAWYAFHTTEAKYLGAVIGLALGNWLKYRLDRRFVFARRML